MIDLRTKHGRDIVKYTCLDAKQLRRMSARAPSICVRLFACARAAGRAIAVLRACVVRRRLKSGGVVAVCHRMATNDTDFMTLDALEDIHPFYIATVLDQNHIFGFDIRSIELLLKSSSHRPSNPYTGTQFDDSTLGHLRSLIKRKIQDGQSSNCATSGASKSKRDTTRRVVSILQSIDVHGYQTDVSWLDDITLRHTKRVYLNLASIFCRHLDTQTRRDISRNADELFSPSTSRRLERTRSLNVARDILFTHIEHMINDGCNDVAKNTGALHVIHALAKTLPRVRRAVPWLS